MVRAFGLHPEGYRFKSYRDYHLNRQANLMQLRIIRQTNREIVMILKIMRSTIPPGKEDQLNTTFLDGFDYICKKFTDIKDVESECQAYASSYFTDQASSKVLAMYLMKGKNIIHYVVVDGSYTVYLMSNEGKTIERFY